PRPAGLGLARFLVDAPDAEALHRLVIQLGQDAPVDRLDLQIAQVLDRLSRAADTAEVSVKTIVPGARGLPVDDHVLVALEVDALVAFRAQKYFRAHRVFPSLGLPAGRPCTEG